MSEDSRVIDIENKVSRLEAAVENTQDSIRSLAESTEKQISSLATTTEHQIERLAITINKMSEHQFTNQKTNWSQIWTAAGVLVILFSSLIGGFVLNPLAQIVEKQSHTEYVLSEHMKDGHPKSVLSFVDDNEKDINEINNWINTYFPMLIAIKEHHYNLDNEIQYLKNKSLKNNSHEERLRSLERETFPGTNYRSGRPGG